MEFFSSLERLGFPSAQADTYILTDNGHLRIKGSRNIKEGHNLHSVATKIHDLSTLHFKEALLPGEGLPRKSGIPALVVDDKRRLEKLTESVTRGNKIIAGTIKFRTYIHQKVEAVDREIAQDRGFFAFIRNIFRRCRKRGFIAIQTSLDNSIRNLQVELREVSRDATRVQAILTAQAEEEARRSISTKDKALDFLTANHYFTEDRREKEALAEFIAAQNMKFDTPPHPFQIAQMNKVILLYLEKTYPSRMHHIHIAFQEDGIIPVGHILFRANTNIWVGDSPPSLIPPPLLNRMIGEIKGMHKISKDAAARLLTQLHFSTHLSPEMFEQLTTFIRRGDFFFVGDIREVSRSNRESLRRVLSQFLLTNYNALLIGHDELSQQIKFHQIDLTNPVVFSDIIATILPSEEPITVIAPSRSLFSRTTFELQDRYDFLLHNLGYIPGGTLPHGLPLDVYLQLKEHLQTNDFRFVAYGRLSLPVEIEIFNHLIITFLDSHRCPSDFADHKLREIVSQHRKLPFTGDAFTGLFYTLNLRPEMVKTITDEQAREALVELHYSHERSQIPREILSSLERNLVRARCSVTDGRFELNAQKHGFNLVAFAALEDALNRRTRETEVVGKLLSHLRLRYHVYKEIDLNTLFDGREFEKHLLLDMTPISSDRAEELLYQFGFAERGAPLSPLMEELKDFLVAERLLISEGDLSDSEQEQWNLVLTLFLQQKFPRVFPIPSERTLPLLSPKSSATFTLLDGSEFQHLYETLSLQNQLHGYYDLEDSHIIRTSSRGEGSFLRAAALANASAAEEATGRKRVGTNHTRSSAVSRAFAHIRSGFRSRKIGSAST